MLLSVGGELPDPVLGVTDTFGDVDASGIVGLDSDRELDTLERQRNRVVRSSRQPKHFRAVEVRDKDVPSRVHCRR
ncbi:hypothetical protein ACLMAL_31780 [Nocardia sp. CWNU-33]|uniref:hypothetical protein n=1 Tax=Nocardia sp. CWNU-33 TaxID=3392117 RepID=UPI00398F1A5C